MECYWRSEANTKEVPDKITHTVTDVSCKFPWIVTPNRTGSWLFLSFYKTFLLKYISNVLFYFIALTHHWPLHLLLTVAQTLTRSLRTCPAIANGLQTHCCFPCTNSCYAKCLNYVSLNLITITIIFLIYCWNIKKPLDFKIFSSHSDMMISIRNFCYRV